MKAIILAAGRGSRMEHLTATQPKCLVPFRGKPLLEWQLDAIHTAGLSDISIVTGYRAECLSFYKLTEFHNKYWFENNMVASLACADEWLRSGPCIVSYSDIFYDTSAISSLIESTASLAITYDPNWLSIWEKRFDDPLSDAETFSISTTNRITNIGETPNNLGEIQGQYMGLLRITPESWAEFSNILAKYPKYKTNRLSMTEILKKVVEQDNLPLVAIPYEKEWGEIDSPSDLKLFDPTTFKAH